MSISIGNNLHGDGRVSFAGVRAAALWCVIFGSLSAAGCAQTSGPLLSRASAEVPTSLAGGEADMRVAGSICGTVKDVSGATIAGAAVTLATGDPAGTRQAESNGDGVFSFAGVPAGAYTLTIAEPGFDVWARVGRLGRGESVDLSEIALAMAPSNAEVEVTASRTEIAEAQIKLEEKQRVLGVFPNFYAAYVWDAAPLSARQKYKLAWRFAVDPVAFGMAGAIAGTEQSENGFSGYGQGMQGYAKRFGATYADGFTSTLLGQAVLPALLHQDPRYFVKGTGTVRERAQYALAMTVMCRGDNGRWQVNASNMLGNVASASLSNVYYPASNRNGAGLTVENSLISTSAGALANLIQEFMLHRMTPGIPDYGARR